MDNTIQLLDVFDTEYMRGMVDIFSEMTGIDILIADSSLKPLYCTNKRSWLYKFATSEGESENFKWLDKLRDSLITDMKMGREMILGYPAGISLGVLPIILNERSLGNLLIAVRKLSDSVSDDTEDMSSIAFSYGNNSCHFPREVSEERFGQIFSFLHTLNKILTHVGEMKTKLMAHDSEIEGITRQMGSQYQMLRKFFDSEDIALYVFDYYTGNIIMANRAYCEMFEVDLVDTINQKCWEIDGNALEDFLAVRASFEPVDSNETPLRKTWTYYNEKFGKWLKSTAQTLNWYGGIKVTLMTVLDVSREETLREELYKIAYYDEQSGLPNELKLRDDINDSEISRDLSRISRYAEPRGMTKDDVNMIALDMTSLWYFRNAYGWEATGVLLNVMLEWLKEQDFPDATLYRMSVYRFCMVVRSDDRDKVRYIAAKIQRRFQESWPVTADGEELSYFSGAKVSVIYLPRGGMPTANMLERVIEAMDIPRSDGETVEYDEAMGLREKEEILFKSSLKNCVNGNMLGFSVSYQPIVGMSSGKWEGVEALCRWTDPKIGQVSPARFIPEAERMGLIVRIGAWILDKALEDCKALALDKHESFFLSVNISPIQLMDPSFADNVIALLKKHGYPGEKLNLEITESVEVTFNRFTIAVIESLRASGVKISLDDFGTGYASFRNLKNLPVDFLKTECDFVKGIEHDSYTQYYFNIIVDMAHVSGMKLITEGVDSKECLDIVRLNGADFVQGYYFSEPMSYEELSGKLKNFRGPCVEFLNPDKGVKIKRWLEGSEAYFMTPNLSKLLDGCMSALCSDKPVSSSVEEVLGMIGKAFGLGRAFIFKADGGSAFIKAHEWRSHGVEPFMEIVAACEIGLTSRNLSEIFRNDGMFVASGAEALGEDMTLFFKETGTVAIALMPVWNESELIGVVGFDYSRKHEWSSDEIFMLRNLGMIMSGNLRREHIVAELAEKNDALMSILNSAGLMAFAEGREAG